MLERTNASLNARFANAVAVVTTTRIGEPSAYSSNSHDNLIDEPTRAVAFRTGAVVWPSPCSLPLEIFEFH